MSEIDTNYETTVSIENFGIPINKTEYYSSPERISFYGYKSTEDTTLGKIGDTVLNEANLRLARPKRISFIIKSCREILKDD